MAWSEKAIAAGVAAWLESDPSMTNEYVIARVLDAASAAQWNEAIDAALLNCRAINDVRDAIRSLKRLK